MKAAHFWTLYWLLLGVYFVACSIGGSLVAPLAIFVCGWMAKESVK